MKLTASAVLFLFMTTACCLAQKVQMVEGFDQVESQPNLNGPITGRDFRGSIRGYMTKQWWTHDETKPNRLSWRTAMVPAQQLTTFAFIGASSVLPPEFSRGPEAKLSVNGKYALTFSVGFGRDVVWTEGEYELRYLSRRVEQPFGMSHRQFDLYGNSGFYHLKVPASAVEAGKPAVIEVELLPFAGWDNGWFAVKERRDVLKRTTYSLQTEIDTLRTDLTAATQQIQALASQVYRGQMAPEKSEHHILYTNGFRHLHPADVIQLKNGDLLLLTREGTEHISDDGDVIMLRSTDGGKTWGGRQVIAGIPNVDEREGCGLQLKDGTIMVGIFYNGLYRSDGSYRPHGEIEKQLDEPHKRHLGAYIITSKDDGKTWSEPKYVDTKEMPFGSLEGPTDAMIEMPDGSILMAIIGYSPGGDKGNRAAVMLRSTDQGQSWKMLSTIANDEGAKLGGFMEPGIVRTKTGRIVAGLRNHGTDQALHVTWSDDDGKTWAPVKKTAMIGHPADLIELKDGRLMATYGIRPGVHAAPGGIRACFSSDNGETWDIKTEIPLRGDLPNWDVGYPESLIMPDGKVMTVYYYNLFGKYYLGSTFWNP